MFLFLFINVTRLICNKMQRLWDLAITTESDEPQKKEVSESIQEDRREPRKESRQNQEEVKDEKNRGMEQLEQMPIERTKLEENQELQQKMKENEVRMQKYLELSTRNEERMQKVLEHEKRMMQRLLELSEENHKKQVAERDDAIKKIRDDYENLTAAFLETTRNIGGHDGPNSDAELVRLRESHQMLESKYKEKITEHEKHMEECKRKERDLQLQIRALEKSRRKKMKRRSSRRGITH